MKLSIKGCHSFCNQNGITNYIGLSQKLGLSVKVIRLLERGIEIGYDAVRDIYNMLGETVVLRIIDFGEETLNGFKSKYIEIGNELI